MGLGQQLSKNSIATWNTRQRNSYQHIKITPISPALGAEISNIDLNNELSSAQLTEIHQALAENLVLVFRKQNLTPENHKRFARHFGSLHQHKLSSHYKPDSTHDPEILAWQTGADSAFTAGEAWHSDVTCDAEPIWASLLRITHLPEIGGGDTAFANMYLAYELLSEPLQNLLQNLTAVHDGAVAWTRGYGIPPKAGQSFPANEHPVVAKHPVTGRPFLFVNQGFTSHIKQLNPLESEALLTLLFRHIEKSLLLQTRITWSENTLVIWDNWATQHHAVWDYYPFARWGERVSAFIGSQPTGI